MEKLLARPAEAAEAIGVGRSKMYQMIADGTLPSIRIGRAVRIPVEALRNWVKSQANIEEQNKS